MIRRRAETGWAEVVEPWADDLSLSVKERIRRWDEWMALNYWPHLRSRQQLENPNPQASALFVPDRPWDPSEL